VKAVGITEFGGPDVLRLVEVPEPQAGPGELRIRVHATAVNPTDIAMRTRLGPYAQRLRDIPPPYVPGMDAAGTVDQIGDGTNTDLAVGDHVMAIVVTSGKNGAYAEYVVVPAESAVRVPLGASAAEAASLPMNGLTARLALDVLALRPGQHLAVTGAAGAVGGYAVQLAKADGLYVIADASTADEQLVRELGADVVLPRGDDFARHVRDALPEGVDGLVDGALLDEKVIVAVRDGGGFVAVRDYVGERPPGIVFHRVIVSTYAREHAKLDRLRAQVDAGQLTLRVARTFPADQAAQAHRLFGAGGIRGRIILEF
jgi:NADPH:quinone reductase-like Zn-dependent oxidoreductase